MADGRLPPIEPIVLYNGDARWRAAVDLAELIALPTDSAMWRWQPALRYHVIDEGPWTPRTWRGEMACRRCCSGWKNASGPDQLVKVADGLVARRLGVLHGWATDRVLAADSVTLETRSMRVRDAASVEEIVARR